jgi:hypothetical protein
VNTNYNINEILEAVDKLNSLKKNKQSEEKNISKLNIVSIKDDIPPNTLRLIEESERNFKN